MTRYITKKELTQALEQCADLQEQLILRLLYYGGLHLFELCGLLTGDIGDDGITICDIKHANERFVEMPPDIMEDIRKLIEVRNDDSETVFRCKRIRKQRAEYNGRLYDKDMLRPETVKLLIKRCWPYDEYPNAHDFRISYIVNRSHDISPNDVPFSCTLWRERWRTWETW